MTPSRTILALAAAAVLSVPALAQTSRRAAPAGAIVPNFAHALPNVPGKSLIAVEVNYPPGGATPAHHHAGSAFIYGYVVSGRIRSQVEGQPAKVYKAGESFFEDPGAHHLVSENASRTAPAKLLAVFVVDSADKDLTTLDK